MAGFSFLLLSFCLLFNACSFFQKDPVILQIGDKKWKATVFAQRLAEEINSFNIEYVSDPDFVENLKEQLIAQLLVEYLVEKQAKQLSLTISEKQWQKTLQKIYNSYSSAEVFNLYLKRQNKDQKIWEAHLRRKLLHEKLINHIAGRVEKPSHKETRQYYQSHTNLFRQKPSVLIYHFFHKRKEKVFRVREDLKKNKLTHNNSMGEAGFPKAQKQWVQKGSFDLFDKAFLLKKQEISPVWSSPYGYHLIQVLEKKPGGLIPYKQALPRVLKILMDQRRRAIFAQWLDQQSRKVSIWKDEDRLKKIKLSRTRRAGHGRRTPKGGEGLRDFPIRS